MKEELNHKKNENNCYIHPERVCMEIEFNEEYKFIILASDGIWEFISNQEVVDIIKIFN